MNIFKFGDKVIRVHDVSDFVHDGGFMEIGKEYTVSTYNHSARQLYLVGSDAWYNPMFFELVEAKPKFKEMKIHVNSSEQAKEVQEQLFALGYVWASGSNQVSYLELRWDDYIVTSTDGDFRLVRITDADNKPNLPNVQEYTLNVKKTYELVPVEETVEVFGQLYSKKELEAALLNLKPIQKES